jgi:hypothetical protein
MLPAMWDRIVSTGASATILVAAIWAGIHLFSGLETGQFTVRTKTTVRLVTFADHPWAYSFEIVGMLLLLATTIGVVGRTVDVWRGRIA